MGQLRTGCGDRAPSAKQPSSDLLCALDALAECSAQLENEPLKGTMGHATVTLLSQIETTCRGSVEFLLRDLGSSEESGDVQYDKVWTLHRMSKRSEATRHWIVELGGLTAVPAAMAAHPAHPELLQWGAWLLHDIWGLDGIAALLRHQHLMVRASAAWIIHELAMGGESWPEAPGLLIVILEAMGGPGMACDLNAAPDAAMEARLEVAYSCCAALRRLVDAQPNRGRLLMDHNGAETLLGIIKLASKGGEAGEDALFAATQLLASIVDGNESAAQRLRDLRALEILAGCLANSGKAAECVMWALGSLGGVETVLEVIGRAGEAATSLPSCLMQASLSALSDLVWHPSEDALRCYPKAAPAVLSHLRALAANPQEPDGKTTKQTALALRALGGLLVGLLPHVLPGQWHVTDGGVEVLVEALGPSCHESFVVAAAEALGCIALRAEAWRVLLRRALAALGSRIRAPALADRRAQKYLFWAMAAIAGLPVVLHEMRSQLTSATVQDAAICAIIDILDDSLDNSFSLGGCAEAAAEARQGCQVALAVQVVTDAMRRHRRYLPVQYRGCHALGLLSQVLPASEDVPLEVIDTVLEALWWHPLEETVAEGACNAMRAFLEPHRAKVAATHAAAALREREAPLAIQQALLHFGSKATVADLLEDAAYALGMLEGVPNVLRIPKLTTEEFGPLRAGVLKALFELGRACPELLQGPAATEAAEATEAFVRLGGVREADVQRHAELLRGELLALNSAAAAVR